MIESVWNFYSLWNSRHAVANHECAMERFWSFLCSWTQLVSALQLQCFILLSSPWRSLLDQTTLHINNSHVFARIFFQSLILAKLPFHLQLPSRLLQYSRVPCISLWDSQGKKSGVTPLMLLFSHLFFFPFSSPHSPSWWRHNRLPEGQMNHAPHRCLFTEECVWSRAQDVFISAPDAPKQNRGSQRRVLRKNSREKSRNIKN